MSFGVLETAPKEVEVVLNIGDKIGLPTYTGVAAICSSVQVVCC